MRQLGQQDLALLAQRARHEGHLAPCATYLAMVAPVAMHSSSGWAWTRRRRRVTRKGYPSLRCPDDHDDARHPPTPDRRRPPDGSASACPAASGSAPTGAWSSSAAPEAATPSGSLWIGDRGRTGTWMERCVVDARDLVRGGWRPPGGREGPPRAHARDRRAASPPSAPTPLWPSAVFSLDGVPYVVDLRRRRTADPRCCRHPGPGGRPAAVARRRWVCLRLDRALYMVVRRRMPSEHRAVRDPRREHDTWGLADFIAAEELDRHRGLWWLPSSDALLVEHVDESAVEIRWIGDPAQPEPAPRPHRYPAAGTANPWRACSGSASTAPGAEIAVGPRRLPLPRHRRGRRRAGGHHQRPQPRPAAPADPAASTPGPRTSTVRAGEGHRAVADDASAACPSLAPDGALLEVVANVADDCFQLVADDRAAHTVGPQCQRAWSTPRRADRIIVAADDPQEQHVLLVDRATARSRDLTDGPDRELCGGPMPTGSSSTTADGDAAGNPTSAPDSPGGEARDSVAGRAPDRRAEGRLPPGRGARPLGRRPVAHRPRSRAASAARRDGALRRAARRRRRALGWRVRGGPVAGRSGLRRRGHRRPRDARTRARVGVRRPGRPGAGGAQDQVDGLAALAEMYPDLDTSRVGITGWSFGGYLAALAVLDRPDVFHCAVAGAPVTDWRLYDTAYTERYLGLPERQRERVRRHRLLHRASTADPPAAADPRARRRQRARRATPCSSPAPCWPPVGRTPCCRSAGSRTSRRRRTWRRTCIRLEVEFLTRTCGVGRGAAPRPNGQAVSASTRSRARCPWGRRRSPRPSGETTRPTPCRR